MSQPNMYLEYSIVELKPRILDFLSEILAKAKRAADHAITLTMKSRELAELVGKDPRTVARYLTELEEHNVIEKQGMRGRGGGMVILFNTDLIRFESHEGATLNSEEPITLEEIVQKNRPQPKKKKEPTRYRRTARQMAEASILQNEVQTANDTLNQQVRDNGGVPTWEIFQNTPEPENYYQAYLLSRVYNRYGVLFTQRQNEDAEKHNEGNNVGGVSRDYDVLNEEFFGTARFNHFNTLREFCEENRIDPVVYLSAQFSRSVFTASNRGHKKPLPFVNAMTGDNGYAVYLQHCKYQTKHSLAYNFRKGIPAQFSADVVISAIKEELGGLHKQTGFLQYKTRIRRFLEGEYLGLEMKDRALAGFYRLTDRSLKEKNVSIESREVIKKFLLTQSLMLTGGIQGLPQTAIVGSESVRLTLESISRKVAPQDPKEFHAMALGEMSVPMAPPERRQERGKQLVASIYASEETYKVLDLIHNRQRVAVPVSDINKALQEYGTDKIPLDEFSTLDVAAIVAFMEKIEEVQEVEIIDPKSYTERTPYYPSNKQSEETTHIDAMRDFDDLIKREIG